MKPLTRPTLSTLLISWWIVCVDFCLADDRVDYQRDIRPILSDRCYVCHGPDESARQADLRLDIREDALYVLSPDDVQESELLRRITADDTSERMPPEESKLSLTADEIKLLRRWIQQGARWQKHWSFEIPQSPALPSVNNPDWPRNEIDYFILAKLGQLGWSPSPAAARTRLIRRATFDLTGLPPTLAELDQFLGDDQQAAYERLVDRLLSSPAYGERMASEWLDVARYSDTFGYQVDRDRRVWPWRDWVVRAFNANQPYDRFVTEQLAGDLIPQATDDQILATTFNRLHSQKVEGGSVPEEFRVEYVADRTHTFATAFLGLTLECARCHDHKFDPLSQSEYYQLFSFFNNIDEAGLYSYFTNSVPTPTLVLADEAQKQELDRLRIEVTKAEKQLQDSKSGLKDRFKKWLSQTQVNSKDDRESKEEIRGLVKQIDFATVNLANNQIVESSADEPVVRLTGDDEIKLDVGNFHRYEPFSISCRILVPDRKTRAVIFHRSRAWTDAASRGYEMLIEDGKLSASLIHFWPGNAISVKTQRELPIGKWIHVAMTYDGSSRAHGIRLLMDGEPAKTESVRDQLTKNITGGGQDNIAIGARFRDRGFAGGLIRDFRVYDRQLSPIEVRHLFNEQPLKRPTDQRAGEISESERNQWSEYYRLNVDQEIQQQSAALQTARKALCEYQDRQTEIMVMREMETKRQAYVLSRGAYDKRLEPVDADTPSILDSLPDGTPRNRLSLAAWLTQPDHPLLARVTVNRYWQMIFGRALVLTPEDFGSQGSPPSHPELLDWLARDFVDNGWDIKRLIKQMVTSATYRQQSVVTSKMNRLDPSNVYLARAPSYRLPAEMIRDNVLSVSGLLVTDVGGPPAKPYQVAASFKPTSPDKGQGLYRRSLYTYWKRSGPAPVLTTFDASKRSVCRVKRERTASPLQGLVLLNDPQVVEAARKLAEKLIHRYSLDEPEKISDDMFRMLTSRYPTVKDQDIILKLFEQQIEYFTNNSDAASQYLAVGESEPDASLDATQLAAWATVANSLMTLDECVVKR